MLGLRTPPQRNREISQTNYSYGGGENASAASTYNSYEQENNSTISPGQQRAYMSSLASMYGDYEANLTRKRRMQEEFAESLRRQIEEKKAREHVREPVTKQANEMLHDMQKPKNQFYTYSEAPEPIQEASRNDLAVSMPPVKKVSFAPTITLAPQNDFVFTQITETRKPQARSMPVEKFVSFRNAFESEQSHIQPKTIQVSTESPFARQKVGTPPLGFSIRRSQPVKMPLSTTTGAVQKRILPPTKAKTSLSNPKPTFFDTSNFTAEEDTRPSYPGPPNGGDVWELRQLNSVSELVYPDGHISQR